VIRAPVAALSRVVPFIFYWGDEGVDSFVARNT